MPRAIDAPQEFTPDPAFQEEAAPPPADADAKLAQARKDLAAMDEQQTQPAGLKPDETAPGGIYIVGGQLVDAWGQPIKDGK